MISDVKLEQGYYCTFNEFGEKINNASAVDLGKLVKYTDHFLLFLKNGCYITYDETFGKINESSEDKLGDFEYALGVSLKFKDKNRDVFTYDVNFEKINKNDPRYYFRIGTNIVPEGIFERFPELIPAVGVNYYRDDGKHKKLMIVAESNYFRKELASESVFQDAEKWYKGKDVGLIPKSKENDVRNWKAGHFKKVYDAIDEVLKKHNIECHHKYGAVHEVVFYDYFLRPALDRGNYKSIEPEEIDCKVAGVALKEIISRLELDVVVFVSYKSHDAFEKFLGNDKLCKIIHRLPHPRKWNENVKEEFKKLLEEHYIIK